MTVHAIMLRWSMISWREKCKNYNNYEWRFREEFITKCIQFVFRSSERAGSIAMNNKIAHQINSVELNGIYYFNESTEDSGATRGLQSDYLKSIN